MRIGQKCLRAVHEKNLFQISFNGPVTAGGRQLLLVQFYTTFVFEPGPSSRKRYMSAIIQQTPETIDVA